MAPASGLQVGNFVGDDIVVGKVYGRGAKGGADDLAHAVVVIVCHTHVAGAVHRHASKILSCAAAPCPSLNPCTPWPG